MKKPLLRRTASQTENKTSVDTQPARDDQALLLSISSIVIKQNPRTGLGDLAELKNSIADKGILNPLLVAKTATGWELLGGHRRLECAKLLGLANVPCRVVRTDEPEVIKLLDNIMREMLSPQDECLALKRLLPRFDGNKSALARALSKSPSYVNRAVRAADLIESGLCAGAQLSKTALMELADSPDPEGVLRAAADNTKESIRRAREEIAGSKTERNELSATSSEKETAKTVQYRERRDGSAFTLRITFDAKKTGPETKAEIVRHLEGILARLKT